jgi:hypothetical protein
MTDPVVFRQSKVYAWVKVAQINDTGDITSDTSATTMTVDSGHRLIVGMDVLIESEAVKVTAINTSTHAITIDRAEVTDTSATTTSAATHANDTAIYAWSELVDGNGTTLVQQLNIVDQLYKPRTCQLIIANPFSGNKTSGGILEGVVVPSTALKVVDGENYSVLFYGKASTVTKQQTSGEGNTLHITAYDNLFELARTKIGGESSIVELKDSSGSNSDVGSTHSAAEVIKFLVKKFQFGGDGTTTDGSERNITTTEPVSGSSVRFQPSSQAFSTITRNSKVSFGSSDVTVLYALKRLAAMDQIETTTKFGFVFDADPNFTSFSTASKPAQMLDYYQSGFMPHNPTSSSPSTGKLAIKNYQTVAGGNVNRNGGDRPMRAGAAFDQINHENLTEIIARFRSPHSGKMIETNFELFHWKSQSISTSHLSTRYGGKDIVASQFDTNGTFGSEDPDKANSSTTSSWLTRVVKADNKVVGYLQFQPTVASTQSGGSGTLILSGTSLQRAGTDVSAGETLYIDKYVDGSSEDTITLSDVDDPTKNWQFRPQQVTEQRHVARMDFGTNISNNDIRKAIASRFMQKGIPKIRGRFSVDGKYLAHSLDVQVTGDDTVATASAGTKTKTTFTDDSVGDALLTLDNSATAGDYPSLGLRAGHSINKLNAQHGTADTYGYLEKVTDDVLVFMLNSGTIAENDYVRVNVPLRAGHSIVVNSIAHNIGITGSLVGGGAMVTSMSYMETGSRAFTDIETISQNSTNSSQDIIAQDKTDLSDLDEQTDDDFGGIPYGFESEPHFTGTFSAGDVGGGSLDTAINYSAGDLYIGGNMYSITADDSEDATYGINGAMSATDTDSDGEPDTRYVVYFEPAASQSKFWITTETAFEARNAIEGRLSASNLRIPIGQNRVKIGIAYASTAGEDAIFSSMFRNIVGRPTTTAISGSADTSPQEYPSIGPNSYGPVINNNWHPAVDDTYDMGRNAGGVTRMWDDIHATNGTIQTSDIRNKEEIQPINLGLDFVKDLNPVTYKWKKKKENKLDQVHYGIIAQETLEVLKKYGINSTKDFGGIIGDEENRYGARYTEFVAILIKAIQELSDEIDKLKNEGEE